MTINHALPGAALTLLAFSCVAACAAQQTENKPAAPPEQTKPPAATRPRPALPP